MLHKDKDEVNILCFTSITPINLKSVGKWQRKPAKLQSLMIMYV